MSINKENLDVVLYRIMRVMWFVLSVVSVYILYTVYSMSVDAEAALGVYHTVPEMIEHLLAGCVVVTALGTVFQYLTSHD